MPTEIHESFLSQHPLQVAFGHHATVADKHDAAKCESLGQIRDHFLHRRGLACCPPTRDAPSASRPPSRRPPPPARCTACRHGCNRAWPEVRTVPSRSTCSSSRTTPGPPESRTTSAAARTGHFELVLVQRTDDPACDTNAATARRSTCTRPCASNTGRNGGRGRTDNPSPTTRLQACSLDGRTASRLVISTPTHD